MSNSIHMEMNNDVIRIFRNPVETLLEKAGDLIINAERVKTGAIRAKLERFRGKHIIAEYCPVCDRCTPHIIDINSTSELDTPLALYHCNECKAAKRIGA